MKKHTLISILLLLSAALIAQTRQTPPTFAAKTHQQHTMMLLGKVDIGGGVFTTNANDIVFAFIDGECRGTANPMSEHNGLIFLSIAENTEQAKPISFMVWLDERQELLPLNEGLSFEPLAAVGELNDPFLFTLGEMVGVEENKDGNWIGEPYPNPFNEQTNVPYFLHEAAELRFSIYDSRGVKVRAESSFTSDKGHQQFSIERVGLAKGVYVLNVNISNNSTTVFKMTKLIIN